MGGDPSERSDTLRAEGLRKRYGGLIVLDDVSLSLPNSGRLGVIGPNGSGKTTLLGALSGFIPAEGGVWIEGRDLSHASASRRARAGIARTFQIAAVVEAWTVYDNIAFAAAAHRKLGWGRCVPLRHNGAVRAEVEQAAERWGLGELLSVPVSELSYGIVRRTELAVATLGEPRVLLLDEPAAGLSHEEGAGVMQTVRELFPTTGIVLVEHDMEIMFDFCEELLVLDHGKVIASGDPAEVRADPLVREAYLGSVV
jgi:ABC-type branched-subunit amino acid transport system ATPase component